MIERLYPGVYLTEVPFDAKPIDGVSAMTSPSEGTHTAEHAARLGGESAPGWTQPNQGDPGVTLVELFAFLAETPLHRAAQQFADSARGHGGDADTLLAQYVPQGGRHAGANGTVTPLYSGQQPPAAGQVQPLTPPPPAIPGAPIDLRRMESLNATVQSFKIARSPVDADDLRATQHSFQAATDALKAGDYKKAEQALRNLGFPLPPPGSGQRLSQQGAITAHMLGVPAQGSRTSWSIQDVRWGARGNQALNDVNGFAANAIMINRMASAPGGVSNPPTEAQATKYMRELAQPANGNAPTAQQIVQAASEITNGSIVHYSAAGAQDPQYGANPKPHAFYRDRQGQIHEFESTADAQAAARAGKPPIEHGGRITTMQSRSPDAWSDITSQGTRAGRHIGDCESKVYLQTRLLTEAGFTAIGSVDVHPKGGGIGHMFGVFKAPDGTIWVTSNEQFRQVKPSDPKLGVTQADLDATLHVLTADVYHIEPNFRGVRDTSDFNFAAAATTNQTGANAATDTIRRSTEVGVLGRIDTLIPPPVRTNAPQP